MSSTKPIDIGATILRKLGLTDEEAELMKKMRPEPSSTIYARDQSGVGHQTYQTNVIEESNDVFARFAQKYGTIRTGLAIHNTIEEPTEPEVSQHRPHRHK